MTTHDYRIKGNFKVMDNYSGNTYVLGYDVASWLCRRYSENPGRYTWLGQTDEPRTIQPKFA